MQSLFKIVCFLFIINNSFLSYAETCSIRGRVINSDNIPIKNAEVYCEQSLLSPLIRIYTDINGEFEFRNLVEGPTGIFATAESMAWSGIHINLPAEEDISGLEIMLVPAVSINGRIVVSNEKGKEIGISGAEVDRFAILGVEKVAIPCSKLTSFGYKKVVSDKDGYFVLDKVPYKQSISVKVVHPEYAVTTVENISPGQDVKIMMSKGCVVLGSVYTLQNDNKVKVANSDVTIKNVRPPYESICVRTNTNGEFTIRLNLGTYLCRAEASQLQSAGWEIKQVVNSIGEHIQIQVFPSVYVSGQIMDAITGKPVSGAKVSIEQGGKKALSLTTGSKGKYRAKVVYGQVYIRFEAIPGYTTPQPSQLRIVVSGKDEIILPGVWVKKIDSLRVKFNVPGQDKLTVKRGIVSVMEPPQLGWYTSDVNSPLELNLSSIPVGGKVLGYAEIPEEDKGNIFIVDNRDINKLCEIDLYSLSSIKGRVLNKDGKPVPGVIISCFLTEGTVNREYLLWRIISKQDGDFFWDSVVPLKTLIFKIYTNDGSILWQSPEVSFLEGENKDLGDILVDVPAVNIKNREEILIKSNYMGLCGEEDIINKLCSGPSVLIFVDKAEVFLMEEVLKNIKSIVGDNFQVGLIIEERIDCNEITIPIILGKRPSIATTYFIDNNGKIVCETFGLPIVKRMIKKQYEKTN